MPWKAFPGSKLDESFPYSLITAKPMACFVRLWSISTALPGFLRVEMVSHRVHAPAPMGTKHLWNE